MSHFCRPASMIHRYCSCWQQTSSRCPLKGICTLNVCLKRGRASGPYCKHVYYTSCSKLVFRSVHARVAGACFTDRVWLCTGMQGCVILSIVAAITDKRCMWGSHTWPGEAQLLVLPCGPTCSTSKPKSCKGSSTPDQQC